MPGNPMQDLLKQQMGIDAFSLDGDEGMTDGDWADLQAHSLAIRQAERRLDALRRN